MTKSRKFVWATAVAIIVSVTLSCATKQTEETATTGSKEAESGPVFSPTGNEGSIAGVIAYTAAAPTPRKIQMDSDPICAQKGKDATSEELLVKDGKLQNVFVFVKSGLPRNTFPTPSQEVVLDQVGCRYVPHVVGLQTNQAFKVVNSDATNHNVHPVPQKNREWNETQYASAPPIIKKFPLEEVLIPVKCNQHSWMKAWVGVLKHPFFAVSGADGTFTIKGLPPGEYELEAWHEKLNSKTLKVTVKEKTEAKADFSFEASTAYQPATLKLQPALVLP
jgi:hypothetical protein